MSCKPDANPCGGEPLIKISGQPCSVPTLSDVRDTKSCCSSSGPSSGDSGAGVRVFLPEDYWVKGTIQTPAGEVPQVGTSLVFRDTLGSWKARWGVNRMGYKVPPGLYGTGNPDSNSPVLVTANYKMTFDRLREKLTGLNAWILVLDTFGINVWCAAGKGTFGTDELVRRVAAVGLSRVVSHHTLILPQLGAPGVAAHEVRRQTGFKVVYGPIRAGDIKEFLLAGMKAGAGMRTVTFGFMERLILTPIEVMNAWKPVAIIAAALILAHVTTLMPVTFSALYPFIGAFFIGAVLAPALLPWIPGRAFSWKGWLAGLAWTMAVFALHGVHLYGTLNALALLFLLPALSAFLTLNFTGASTYTSLSGVRREMRFAVPAIVVLASAGIGLWIVGLVVKLV
jgi:hypothetical protein